MYKKKQNEQTRKSEVMKKKLTKQQKLFTKEYLVDLNATQSAIRAGYSKKTARSQGQRLLTNVNIQKLIQKEMDKRSKRIELTSNMVIDEIRKLAFGNIKNLYDENGNLIPISDLPEDVSATIQELTQDNLGSGDDSVVVRRKYKLAGKKGNLELLGKHLKLFTDKTEVSGPNGGPVPPRNFNDFYSSKKNWSPKDYKKVRKQMLKDDDC